jgi:hypothetical protein
VCLKENEKLFAHIRMDEFCQRAKLFLKVGIETKKLTKTNVGNFEMKEKQKMKMMMKKMMMMMFRQK